MIGAQQCMPRTSVETEDDPRDIGGLPRSPRLTPRARERWLLVSDDAYRAIEDARDVSPQTAQRWVEAGTRGGRPPVSTAKRRGNHGQHSVKRAVEALAGA